MPDLFDDAAESEPKAAPESEGTDTADGEAVADAPTPEKSDG